MVVACGQFPRDVETRHACERDIVHMSGLRPKRVAGTQAKQDVWNGQCDFLIFLRQVYIEYSSLPVLELGPRRGNAAHLLVSSSACERRCY